MTKALLISALMLSLPAYSQVPNAGFYTVNVHVSASRIADNCLVAAGVSLCKSVQQLTALIDGVKYQLQGEIPISKGKIAKGIVALGDYKAKLVDDQQKATGEFTRAYDLMFP